MNKEIQVMHYGIIKIGDKSLHVISVEAIQDVDGLIQENANVLAIQYGIDERLPGRYYRLGYMYSCNIEKAKMISHITRINHVVLHDDGSLCWSSTNVIDLGETGKSLKYPIAVREKNNQWKSDWIYRGWDLAKQYCEPREIIPMMNDALNYTYPYCNHSPIPKLSGETWADVEESAKRPSDPRDPNVRGGGFDYGYLEFPRIQEFYQLIAKKTGKVITLRWDYYSEDWDSMRSGGSLDDLEIALFFPSGYTVFFTRFDRYPPYFFEEG